VIGTRYTEQLVNEYVGKGFWDPTLLSADLCDQCARDYPDKEAVVDTQTRLTWGEVGRHINTIARGLIDLGLKKDDVLVTQLPNCVEYFLLFFACEKAGVTITSTQPTFRHAEMEPILHQTQAKAVVIRPAFRNFDYFGMFQELRPRAPELKHIIVLGDEVPPGAISLSALMKKRPKATQQSLERVRFKPWEVTRIFNTSGTTGIPKCFEWPVAPRICSGKVMARRMEMTTDDIVLTGWNLGTGGSLLIAQVCIPLLGAKLVNLEHFSPQEACEMVEREKVTILALVPAEIARLVDYPDLNKYDLSSLRMLFTGTQLLTFELGAHAEEKLNCRIVIIYGAGETGTICTTAASYPREKRLGTVGMPADGNEVKVTDGKGNLLPRGEVGEVYVRGPHIISGYYGRPELTAQAWRTGWFSTDDAGKIDEEGYVVLMGRKRDVIIRGGQNLYPSEIENLLLQHPKVKDVAIVAMPDPVMGQKQCAYVIPKTGQTFTFDEMVGFLKTRKMAPFKLPERLEVRTEFPMNPAGNKVDKLRLEADVANKLKQETQKGSK